MSTALELEREPRTNDWESNALTIKFVELAPIMELLLSVTDSHGHGPLVYSGRLLIRDGRPTSHSMIGRSSVIRLRDHFLGYRLSRYDTHHISTAFVDQSVGRPAG